MSARACANSETVAEYAEAMRSGAAFPPIHVWSAGEDHWIGDGYHRSLAARQAGFTRIWATVHPGRMREALLYSVNANRVHGLPRSNADKRRAVQILLGDSEWTHGSEREIARRAGVSDVPRRIDAAQESDQ
jgi:hypothetical protein